MTEFDPPVGVPETLEPGIRRILAPNPSPMTYRGTNTYLLGAGEVAVVDPGPDRPAHAKAILTALDPGEQISHILVTHSHIDHSPLAHALSAETGAPVYGYGDSMAGQSEQMRHLAEAGLTGGGEGVDRAFRPDETLEDGARLEVGGLRIEALWTPGHMANHLCFAVGDAVLTGDLVMGWASTMVSPPDGDIDAFLASAARLAARCDRIHYPGHGPAVTQPTERAKRLIAHRQSREADILAALGGAPLRIPDITMAVYRDVAPALLPAAERNVFAHLIALVTRGSVTAAPALAWDAVFARCQ